MIVVLDSNVVISALVFRSSKGAPTRACEMVKHRDLIAICDEIEAEMYGVLTDTFGWPTNAAREALDSLTQNAIRVAISQTLKRCRDPHDDMFLECAEVANADYIVTGDKDLLVLGNHGKTRIITPSEYVLLGDGPS